jgi:hypothetical protein
VKLTVYGHIDQGDLYLYPIHNVKIKTVLINFCTVHLISAIRIRPGQNGVRISVGAKDILTSKHFKTGSGTHPVSLPVGIRVLYRGKVAEE